MLEPIAERQTEQDRTVYVHLCSGDVVRVTHVAKIVTTETHLVLSRGRLRRVLIPRADLYFCSNQVSDLPPSF